MFIFKALSAIIINVAFVKALVLDVAAPKILQPTSATVWTVGGVGVVTWDTSTLPAQISNPIGQVLLGNPSNNSLNLDVDHPLATGFNITAGSVQFTVPNVAPGNNYIVALIGDSGDDSPTFTIVAAA